MINIPTHPPVSVADIDKLQEENEQLKARLQQVIAERRSLEKKLDAMKKWGE